MSHPPIVSHWEVRETLKVLMNLDLSANLLFGQKTKFDNGFIPSICSQLCYHVSIQSATFKPGRRRIPILVYAR